MQDQRVDQQKLSESSRSSLYSKSMFHSRAVIEAGDLVIVYMSRDNLTSIIITPGEEMHNKFGRYAHVDLIGQKFGTKPRYEKALEEFKSHGLENVRLQHRNVCKDGFNDASGVEAVFLDLPAPWEAIPHAMKTLRPDIITKICCFSPCLEQVLKTVSTLRSEGFSDIFTQEVLIRTHELVKESDPDHLTSVSSVVDSLKAHEKRKVERRAVQMKTAREKARRQKENRDGVSSSEHVEPGQKRKLEEDKAEGTPSADIDNEEKQQEQVKEYSAWIEPDTQLKNVVLTKPTPEMKGHTSYLTFASLYPEIIRNAIAAQESSKSAVATPRLAELVAEKLAGRAGSQETEYGSDGLDEVMGTLTEEEMIALAGK
ncbi:hypothetical protein I203_101026 [Kwoniella mangroviensis CBS 8507]|uniref:uncharacterized protein n=1 Tax=Kwoniella mangroviensis CBS 8507 TaxID=1296122 RepID=UPI0030759498